MPTHDRPLSPHLQVYKLHTKIAPVLSISHRLTGMLMFLIGTMFVMYWLGAAAYGPESFATAQALYGSVLGYLVLFGWTMVIMYHLSNGIRHLVWDTGRQVSIVGVRTTGLVMLAAVAGMTTLIWIVGLAVAL